MSGPVALHGGGEFVAGDEDAMDALVSAARTAAGGDPIRVVIVPTAAGRQRPDLAAAHGRRAFEAAAGRAGIELRTDVARIVERADTGVPATCRALAAAHLVHLPGGDPDLVPTVLRDSEAWAAILAAHARGACVAGASAGAMALGERTWTPTGGLPGLGLVPGLAVVPHYAAARLAAWRDALAPDAPNLGWLGLDEQTLVIGRPGEAWAVAGRGRAHLVPSGRPAPSVVAAHGGTVTLR